jgi:hypothetical protein
VIVVAFPNEPDIDIKSEPLVEQSLKNVILDKDILIEASEEETVKTFVVHAISDEDYDPITLVPVKRNYKPRIFHFYEPRKLRKRTLKTKKKKSGTTKKFDPAANKDPIRY